MFCFRHRFSLSWMQISILPNWIHSALAKIRKKVNFSEAARTVFSFKVVPKGPAERRKCYLPICCWNVDIIHTIGMYLFSLTFYWYGRRYYPVHREVDSLQKLISRETYGQHTRSFLDFHSTCLKILVFCASKQ